MYHHGLIVDEHYPTQRSGMQNPQKQKADQTREQILLAAFSEIHSQGFRAASLGNILKNTGVTKGALYHHFPNKQALGYAVFDEIIVPESQEKWLRLQDPSNNPIDVLLEIGQELLDEANFETIQLGCPICNLIQEMSGVDAGFQQRFAEFQNEWRKQLAAAIQRGQENKMIITDVSPESIASFLIAVHDGAASVGKATHDMQEYENCVNEMSRYVNNLRKTH